jgi:RNase P/RNase MRP subunit p29
VHGKPVSSGWIGIARSHIHHETLVQHLLLVGELAQVVNRNDKPQFDGLAGLVVLQV